MQRWRHGSVTSWLCIAGCGHCHLWLDNQLHKGKAEHYNVGHGLFCHTVCRMQHVLTPDSRSIKMHLSLQRASGSSGSKRCAYLGVNCPVAAETDSVGGRIVSLQRLQPEHHLGQCCPFLHDSQCFVHEQNFVFIQRGSMNWYSQQHICSTP